MFVSWKKGYFSMWFCLISSSSFDSLQSGSVSFCFVCVLLFQVFYELVVSYTGWISFELKKMGIFGCIFIWRKDVSVMENVYLPMWFVFPFFWSGGKWVGFVLACYYFFVSSNWLDYKLLWVHLHMKEKCLYHGKWFCEVFCFVLYQAVCFWCVFVIVILVFLYLLIG